MIPLNLTNILGYTFLALLMIYGIYTMIVIYQEKSHFKDDSKSYNLLYYRLFVPYWWTLVKQDTNFLEFARTDTRYDWYGKYILKKLPPLPLPELLENYLQEKNIILDNDDRKITHTEHGLVKTKLNENIECLYRVEGTGTEAETERVYFDVCFLKDKRHEEILICESRSSVLNGSVEGPFFEETLKFIEDL